MQLSIQLYVFVLTGSVLLSIFSSLGTTSNIKDQALEENLTWPIAQAYVTSGNLLRTFKEWKNSSDLFHNVSYQRVAGTLSQKKKLLTIGLSSIQGRYLLSTLQSVFNASSKVELRYFTVLLHLSSPDSDSLKQMILNINKLFALQIQAGQLLVIHTPLVPYHTLRTLRTNISESLVSPVLFKQIVDYAFLMNFATNLSNYFLLMEDNIHCSSNFITNIKRALMIWEGRPWVIMEFSKLGFTGKLCHSSDLPHLASFFLYYQSMSPEKLFPSFYKMLAQKNAIQFSPSLFHPIDFPVQEGNFSTKKHFHEIILKPKDEFLEMDFGKPDNPPAFIYTDMQIFKDYLPEKAYSLEEDFFWALDPMEGNHLTVILKEPTKIRRVQIVTGSEDDLVFLLKGKVELGYKPNDNANNCERYILLGTLQNGKFDHKMLSEEMENKASCLRLVVTTTQDDWIVIKHIKIWVA
ncbi:alpha-1,3-mannosyl-glycoprotein 4-beta-N-acetylglucosaminyltransferase C-like isoform X1 [Monodelphis domestica]|nr:alpha-1,3-mannosyl-glycoprotein 4-beta-N-acetylglucosaminyltransferase C-like isoform X1 [Monodelphis domestica]